MPTISCIITGMKLAIAMYPKGKINTTIMIFCYSLAAVIIVMVVAQLMTIEKFLPIIQNYQLPGGTVSAKVTVFLLATSGIFALPFLMRMCLSPLFRICSATLLNMYALIWVKLGLWVVITHPPLIGTGLLGGLGKGIPEFVILPFSVILLTASLTATWLLRSDLRFKK